MASRIRYFWSTTVPTAVTMAYRYGVPLPLRDLVSAYPGTSMFALQALRVGGGWRAFGFYARPRNLTLAAFLAHFGLPTPKPNFNGHDLNNFW